MESGSTSILLCFLILNCRYKLHPSLQLIFLLHLLKEVFAELNGMVAAPRIENRIGGLTCADIHPGHVCDKKICSEGHQKACCQHHHEDGARHECLHSASCCSDDHVVLTVTGCTSEDNNRHQDVPVSSPIGFHGSQDMASYRHPSAVSKTCGLYGHTSRLIVPGDLRSLLSVWRI